MEPFECVKGHVSGRVQGVGFRYFVSQHARAESICGYVSNLPDGRVEFVLQGEKPAIARMLEVIRQGPSYSRVTDLDYRSMEIDSEIRDFRVR